LARNFLKPTSTLAALAAAHFKYKYWPTKLFQYHNQVNHLRKKNTANRAKLTKTVFVCAKIPNKWQHKMKVYTIKPTGTL